MPTRLLEVYLSERNRDDIAQMLHAHGVLGLWHEAVADERRLFRVLVPADESQAILDELEGRFGGDDAFRMMVFAVEATLPKPQTKPPEEEAANGKQPPNHSGTISRAELQDNIAESIRLTPIYVALVMLSAAVASIGLLRNSEATIIGAMVIAPLLGPNVALALATALADGTLARNALRTGVAGLLMAFTLAALCGVLVPIDPDTTEIAARTRVYLTDIALAIAAGVAGVLSFTAGAPSTLIGVMVAVALMPPLVTAGMLLGAGHSTQAAGALLLALTNIICVNLAGVTTFLMQGIQPRTWWQRDRAKRATRMAIVLWAALLALLAAVIYLSTRN